MGGEPETSNALEFLTLDSEDMRYNNTQSFAMGYACKSKFRQSGVSQIQLFGPFYKDNDFPSKKNQNGTKGYKVKSKHLVCTWEG